MYDYIIIGSGLMGATFAHKAKGQGKRCLVIERRKHLGGNVYCENKEGINIHKYGAHIFHTNNRDVWKFVNDIVQFNRYTNSPIANYKGNFYNLPFNMNTFYQMWGTKTPEEAKAKINEQKQAAINKMKASGTDKPRNLKEQALILVGEDIFHTLIEGYSEKQWGRPCEELPAFIIKRLPLRFTFDNNYFNDNYQGIPIGGYNKLIDTLLEGVETITGVDFFESKDWWRSQAKTIVYTGEIDRFFDYCCGHLNYRTLRFEHECMNQANFQGNAVVNYTDKDIPFTRIIEHKHFELFGDDIDTIPKTIITREYPLEWQPGSEPFYPVNDVRNTAIYEEYRKLATNEKNVFFAGRLAEYKYYDMAPTIEKALSIPIE